MPKRVEEYENDPAYSATQAATGQRIRAIREIAGDTQGKAIERIKMGVTQGAWSKWETGKRFADVFVMSKFAARYKVSLDLIYRGQPTNSHDGIVQLLRAAYPTLVAPEPTHTPTDKGTIQASYMAAISQD